jgi:hypothetical protein
MVFRGNEGNSLDVTNGFAFLDNDEQEYKRRWASKVPPGVFPTNNSLYRFRNQQRTLGNIFTPFGSSDMEDYYQQIYEGTGTFVGNWSYDGTGTSTFRVESDFDTSTFEQTNTTLGFSDFFGTTKIGVAVPETKWDTGRNIPGFTGNTPWSLDRGDVFNVRAGQSAIAADSLEENDSFIGATALGTFNGGALSVNSRAVNNALSLDTKRDRDYYSFVANVTGNISINAANTDATGDDLVYMLYEVDPTRDVEQVPVDEYRAANGNANFVVRQPAGLQHSPLLLKPERRTILKSSVTRVRTSLIRQSSSAILWQTPENLQNSAMEQFEVITSRSIHHRCQRRHQLRDLPVHSRL